MILEANRPIGQLASWPEETTPPLASWPVGQYAS